MYIARNIFDFPKAISDSNKKMNFFEVIIKTIKGEKIDIYKKVFSRDGKELKITEDKTKSKKDLPLMAKLTEMEEIITENQKLISGIIDDYAFNYRTKNLEISLNRQLTKKQYELIEENIKLD